MYRWPKWELMRTRKSSFSKLTVQEIQVDIVNAHETLVQDLLPTTCVTLHVK